MGMVALPFSRIVIKATKPKDKQYPTEVVTLGDHLRVVRLDRGLLQREVGYQMGVDAKSILHWETNQKPPSVRFYPAIMNFLGYCPIERAETLGERIRLHRTYLGLSKKGMAKRLGVDESTVTSWELGWRSPLRHRRSRLAVRLLLSASLVGP